MARKNVLKFPILTNKSLATSFNSLPTIVKFLDNCTYQINVRTADSAGTFKLQASDDFDQDEVSGQVKSAGTWVDLPLGGDALTVAAANDTLSIVINQISFTAIRLVYTSSVAGTGACDALIVAKQLGG